MYIKKLTLDQKKTLGTCVELLTTGSKVFENSNYSEVSNFFKTIKSSTNLEQDCEWPKLRKFGMELRFLMENIVRNILIMAQDSTYIFDADLDNVTREKNFTDAFSEWASSRGYKVSGVNENDGLIRMFITKVAQLKNKQR